MADAQKEQVKERNRLKKILAREGVPEGRIAALRPMLENVSWMKVKLDGAREAIRTAQIVIPYDNGGGQRGVRENPMFRGYEALWKAYLQGMDRIFEALPQEVEKMALAKEAAPKTVLQLVRDKHRQQA